MNLTCHIARLPQHPRQATPVYSDPHGAPALMAGRLAARSLHELAAALRQAGHAEVDWRPYRCTCDACTRGDDPGPECDSLDLGGGYALVGYVHHVPPHLQECPDTRTVLVCTENDRYYASECTSGGGTCPSPRALQIAELEAIDRAMLGWM